MNPHNFRLVFTHKQITASLWATIFTTPTLCAATILDQNQLYSDILATLPFDSSISDHLLHPEGCWSKDGARFLRLDNRIYVLDNTNLRLQVLQYHHDHVLAGHLGQNKTLELIRRHYTWPNICDDVQKFYKSLSQTSFGHISTNSSTIPTVSTATESPWKNLLIGTSHTSKKSVLAEILGRSTGNHHGTIY